MAVEILGLDHLCARSVAYGMQPGASGSNGDGRTAPDGPYPIVETSAATGSAPVAGRARTGVGELGEPI